MSLKNATVKETNRVELEIEVDAAAFEKAVQKAYKKNIGKINVPGFRKGKAPRAFVEKIYGEGVFYEDAINDLYPEALQEAIDESSYEYVDDKVDLDVVSVGKEGLCFKAVITVKPEVELAQYKGLKATKEAVEVTDADVDAEIDNLRERNSRLVTVEGRPAQEGDTVVFDFEGFIDEVPFEGGKGENYSLTLGSGHFIPGFEDQMVGKAAEEDFDVNVTFPEDYQAEELKGKPAVFRCKIHEIKQKELPEANDDLAKDTGDFDTLADLKADIREKLTKQRQDAAEEAFESKLLEQLVEGMKAEIPQAMFDSAIDESVRNFEYRLQSQGLNKEMYLQYTGMDEQQFRDGFKEPSERRVKVRLALETIVKLENLTVSDEELEKEYQKLAEQYGVEADKMKTFVPAKDLMSDLAVGKAADLLKETAVAE